MRVLLADNQVRVRSALHMLLKEELNLSIVGEVAEASDLLAQMKLTHPDLVLLDWELPGLSAINSLPALRDTYPGLVVIALSGRPEARWAALTAGVDAFVSKIDPPEHLITTLHSKIVEKP